MSKIAEVFESMEYGSAPERPDQAKDWLAAHQNRFEHFIGGEWSSSSGAERIESVNPAFGKPLASVAQGTEEDVDGAVRAARGAFKSWNALGGHARARYL